MNLLPLITGTADDEIERWKRTLTALGRSELTAAIRNDYGRITVNKKKKQVNG
jgi:hypothetical protein